MHHPVNPKNTKNCERNQLQVVGPSISILHNNFPRCCRLTWKSLAGLDGALIPIRGPLHLFRFDQGGRDNFRFFWLFPKVLSHFEVINYWIFDWLFIWNWKLLDLNFLFFFLLKRGGFLDSFGAWLIAELFESRFRLFGRGVDLLVERLCLLFLSRGFFLLALGVSLSNGGFPFSNWRLHTSLALVTLHYFLQRESWFLQVHLKLQSILIRNLNFFLESVLSVFQELSDELSWVHINPTKIVLLIGISFGQLESEEDFSVFVEIGKIKVELATSEGHDEAAVSIYKVSVSHYFIFVEFLHAWIRRGLPL